MSLSQKHAGLILVPWLNSQEWKYVYQSAYSQDKEAQQKALELLKIWKMRTPVLSTGVEGTLILLEVLLVDIENLPVEHRSNLYAVALMRFLNLSAANSDRQGSFTRTSTKNELPKWLINLRHDIAHGHQLPSNSNLKMGLEYGFNWLREKYWEPQNEIINDYYVGEKEKDIGDLLNTFEAFIKINMNLFEKINIKNELLEEAKLIISKKGKRRISHPHLILHVLLEVIEENFEKNPQLEIAKKLLQVLVSPRALLKPNFIVVPEGEGNENLDGDFVKIWKKIFNIVHNHGYLFVVLNKLFDVVGDISLTENSKKMAAMWINELIGPLRNLKEVDPSKGNEDLYLESKENLYAHDMQTFQDKVLLLSNKYTQYFLDNLLKYNSNSTEFNDTAINLARVSSNCGNDIHSVKEKIFTCDDLSVENLSIEDVEFTDGSERNNEEPGNINKTIIVAEAKWKKIDDTSVIKKCPLGVLPHQLGQKHPFLQLI